MPASERVAVVLAAGKGTRMRSRLPKVLHRAAGRPLLAWVLDAARAAGCRRIVVVVGHGAEQVRSEIGGEDVSWVVQAEQRGTGHALAQIEERIAGPAQLLVLSGDVPLVSIATLGRLLDVADAGWGAMAVAELRHPGSLGRVIASTADSGGEAGSCWNASSRRPMPRHPSCSGGRSTPASMPCRPPRSSPTSRRSNRPTPRASST